MNNRECLDMNLSLARTGCLDPAEPHELMSSTLRTICNQAGITENGFLDAY
jgi:hypothetical protein